MSLVNLTAGGLTPKYQPMYLARAPADGGVFDRLVTAINTDPVGGGAVRPEAMWKLRLGFAVFSLAPAAVVA
ncbi:hypothetical protein PG997_005750 [Apiospora hydei]|uniref:Uncharacterized protein n=1 Tax=Apiospora hydei TaxID=1337664 RepID=A0ABR1WLV5_9PEZI